MLRGGSSMEPRGETASAVQREIGAPWACHPPDSAGHSPAISGYERGIGPQQRQNARVLLAGDQPLILDMLRDLIEPEFEVVGTVADGRSLVDTVGRLQPGMVLSDITMPDMNGLDAGKAIRLRHAVVKLVYIAVEAELAVVAEAFSFGASGFLLKQCRSSELLHAMRTVRDGGVYLTSLIAGGDVDTVRDLVRANPTSPLSAREVEVLSLLVRGLPMKEVARRLGVTARTVAFHKYNVMSVHGLRGNAELVKFAMQHRMLR
jgi:DNA-binding NarL/FixJ family response regulator